MPETAIRRSLLATAVLGLAFASPSAAGDPGAGPRACPDDARWGLVIDAGSSGSRLRFYCWRSGQGGALPRIEGLGGEQRRPGIADSECRQTPDQAVTGLRPLIAAARETVGERRSADTPLRLMATAGLRRCPKSYQDAMLAGLREYLAGTPFADPRADVISGADEGRYGWVGVNYLLERLDREPPRATVGALDLGGASTQITFMPGTCAAGEPACGELEVGGRSFPLYTQSYLGWGQDQANRRVASRACYLRGYRSKSGEVVGRGRFDACRRAIRKAMKRALRDEAPACARSCNRLGAYQPPVSGDFVGFSAFAYTTGFFGLPSELTLRQLWAAGKDYCRTSWQQATADCEANPRPGCEERWLNRYCFASAYIVTLLHEVYGLPMDRRITSANRLAGADIDWTLGVMVQMAEAASASVP